MYALMDEIYTEIGNVCQAKKATIKLGEEVENAGGVVDAVAIM